MIVDVNLGSRSYRVVVASGELKSVGQRLRDLRLGARAALVSDAAVMRLYGKTVVASLETSGFSVTTIDVPEGEAAKTLAGAQHCWDWIGLPRSWRWAEAPWVTSRVSRPPPTCEGSTSCSCRRRCWPRWTPPSAARPPSTTRWART